MAPPYKCFLKYQHFLTATEQFCWTAAVQLCGHFIPVCDTIFFVTAWLNFCSACHSFSLGCCRFRAPVWVPPDKKNLILAASLQWAAGTPVLPCYSLYYFIFSFYRVSTNLQKYSLSSLSIQYVDCKIWPHPGVRNVEKLPIGFSRAKVDL